MDCETSGILLSEVLPDPAIWGFSERGGAFVIVDVLGRLRVWRTR